MNQWQIIKLNNLVGSKKGKSPKNSVLNETKGYLPYVDIEAFEKGIIKRYVPKNEGIICEKDDVLVVWDGTRSGFVGTGIKGIVGSTIAVLSCKPSILPKYLYSFLKSKFGYINTNPKGAAIPHINPQIFWNLDVPLAPLNEQKRIISKIESIFSRIDAIEKRYELKCAYRFMSKIYDTFYMYVTS